MRISSELRNRIYTTVHADSEGSSSVVADYGQGRAHVKDENGDFRFVTDYKPEEISVTLTDAEWRALLSPEAYRQIFGS